MEEKEIKTREISEREKELGSHITKVRFLGNQVVQGTFGKLYNVFLMQLTPYRESNNSGFSMLEHRLSKELIPDVFIPFGSEVDAVYLNVPEGQKPVLLGFENLDKFRKEDTSEVAE